MTFLPYRILQYLLALVFLAATACYAYTQNNLFLLIPFGALAALFMMQHPHYMLYALMAAIPWSIEFNITPSLGTDLPDEPLMLLTALAVIIFFIYRRKTEMKWASMHPLLLILLLQFLWIILTVITSTDVLLSFKFLLAKSWYLLAFVAAPLIWFRDEKVFRRSVLILMCSMLFFMFVALIRHAQNGWTFEKINQSLLPFYRNHVNYSALLVFMVPLLIAVWQLNRERGIRWITGFTLVVTVGALYFSYSRGAWLALLTGLAAYWLIRRRGLFISFVLVFSLLLASVFFISANDRYLKFSSDYRSTIFHTNFREHLIATYKLKDMSNAERIYRWVAGVRMTPEHWMTGTGPSTFYWQYKNYTVPAFKTWVSRNEEQSTVHNYFLLQAIEQGVVGLLLFLLLIGALFWYLEKNYQAAGDRYHRIVIGAAASILMMECTVNFLSDMIETDKIGSVFYLVVAVVIIIDQKISKSTNQRINESTSL